jgi:hypothetical protein
MVAMEDVVHTLYYVATLSYGHYYTYATTKM